MTPRKPHVARQEDSIPRFENCIANKPTIYGHPPQLARRSGNGAIMIAEGLEEVMRSSIPAERCWLQHPFDESRILALIDTENLQDLMRC